MIVFTPGVLKVSGEGKVHANILRRNSSGYLNTEVAGFAKLTSRVTDSLHGALLAVSESITSYVSLLAGEALCLGSGRNSQENSIAGLTSQPEQAVHFTVQKL